MEFRPSTFRKASSRVLSAWPARFCNSSNVIPARAISAGPSWYNWKENAMHITPAIKRYNLAKRLILYTHHLCKNEGLMGWGQKKKQRKKDVRRRAGNRVHTDFWIQNFNTFSRTFSKTIISFSILKVIKQVINRDLKTQEQSFFRGTLQTYGRGWIRFENEKKFT